MSTPAPTLISTREAAELLGLSVRRVRQLATEGRIPSQLVGGVRLYRVEDVRAFARIDRPSGYHGQRRAMDRA